MNNETKKYIIVIQVESYSKSPPIHTMENIEEAISNACTVNDTRILYYRADRLNEGD